MKIKFVITLLIYVGCASSLLAQSSIPIGVTYQLDEVKKLRTEVQQFDPLKHQTVVAQENEQWLLRALSKKSRAAWATEFFSSSTAGKKEFFQELDLLADAVTAKLPLYQPKKANFEFRSATDEALIKKALPNSASLTIHSIGFTTSDWQIAKNSYDVPLSRYKRGYVWARNSTDDYSFCHLYQVNIIQEYQGGGNYSQSQVKLLGDYIFGCPKP